MVLAYLPSPPANGVSLGPLRLHVYGLLIALGVLAAVWMAQRQWNKIGGPEGIMTRLACWGVPGGIVGARLYSVITSWQVDTGGHWYKAFEIWDGGLGIWGGIVGGLATGLYGAHRMGLPFRPLLDCVAAGFPLAEAVGRWGNYFNQELYGWRTTLPWGLHIDGMPGHYQPTFLYECIWDLIVCLIVVRATGRVRLRRGYLLAVYASCYTFGRFFIEYMRIDPAHHYLGLRLNDWTSIIVFTASTAILLTYGRARPGDDMAGMPLPAFAAPDVADADPDRHPEETDASPAATSSGASGPGA